MNEMEIILFICSAILLLVKPSIEVTTSCNIPNAELGQPTNLTCKFSEDINKLRRDFKVELYLNNQTESTVTVLDCHWFNSALECDTHECCTFDKNVSDSIQVHFRRITSEYVGKYVCFVLPASIGSSEFCNFTFKENLITTVLPPEQLTQAVGTASHSEESLAALVIIPIAIIIIVVVVFVCYKNKGLRRKAKKCLPCKMDTTVDGNDTITENTTTRKLKKALLPPCDSGNGNILLEGTQPDMPDTDKQDEILEVRLVEDILSDPDMPVTDTQDEFHKRSLEEDILTDMPVTDTQDENPERSLEEDILPDMPVTDTQDEIPEGSRVHMLQTVSNDNRDDIVDM